MPANATCCGLSELLSVNVRVPLYDLGILAVNRILIEHDAAGAMLPPQSLVSEKDPVVEMLAMERALAPVLVKTTLCVGGGHGFNEEFNLQENVSRAGMSCAVPLVSVMTALLSFVGSVMEPAFTSTLVFAGRLAGPLKLDVPGLPVLAGFIVPHPGEQFELFCVRVQFNP